jgi:hypothetical protein
MTLLPLFVFVMVGQSALGNENEETRPVGFTARTNDEDDAAGWTSNRASHLLTTPAIPSEFRVYDPFAPSHCRVKGKTPSPTQSLPCLALVLTMG